MTSYVAADLRRAVELRANYLCEYSKIHEDDTDLGCLVGARRPRQNTIQTIIFGLATLRTHLSFVPFLPFAQALNN